MPRIYESWEELRAELDSLKTEDSEVQHVISTLQSAAKAELPYDLGLMSAMARVVRRLVESAEESATEVLSDPKAIAQQFDQPGWSPEVAQNAGKIINHIYERAPVPKAEEPQPLAMPVVLVTLDQLRMSELTEGKAFDGLPPTLQEHFVQMEGLLRDEGCGDLGERYGNRTLDWRPFGAEGPTIQQLISETFVRVNELGQYQPALVPQFLDIGAVWDDRTTLRRLRQGCIVIIDSFAMRHPAVQSWFHRSLLDAFPTTAVLAFAPIQLAFAAGRELSVIVQLQLGELEFARRLLDIEEDTGVCLESANKAEIEKWLATRLRELARQAGAANGVSKFMPFADSGASR